MLLHQVINDTRYVVGPAQASNIAPILPIPKWDERHVVNDYSSLEIAIITISFIFVVISISIGVFVIIQMDEKIIRYSSPPFLLSLLLGSIFIYVSVIASPIHGLTLFFCHLRPWLLGIGFFLLFGSLFVRNWRLYQIYSGSKKLQQVLITNSVLAFIIFGICSVEIILLFIYSIFGEVEIKTIITDPYRPSTHRYMCKSNDIGLTVSIISVIYGGLVVLFGLYNTILIKRLQDKMKIIDETKVIFFSMYNVLFFSILALVVIVEEEIMSEILAYVLRSIFILLAAFITVIRLFYSKLIFSKKYQKKQDPLLKHSHHLNQKVKNLRLTKCN